MRYTSFDTRSYLLRSFISQKQQTHVDVLEIGVGLAGTVPLLIHTVNEYHGVDISEDTINYLKNFYRNEKKILWHCMDVTKKLDIGKRFDIIISADTLEHISYPKGYFSFVSRHLKKDGTAYIVFPNESQNKHHGVTWFNDKTELLSLNQSIQPHRKAGG